jgi:hypothetical protein
MLQTLPRTAFSGSAATGLQVLLGRAGLEGCRNLL